MINKSQYNSIYEWKLVAPNMFDIARKRGWLNEIYLLRGWDSI